MQPANICGFAVYFKRLFSALEDKAVEAAEEVAAVPISPGGTGGKGEALSTASCQSSVIGYWAEGLSNSQKIR